MHFTRPPCLWLAVALLAMLAGCDRQDPHGGRLVLKYWEKWTGFEGEAMQEIVDDFNASQDRIFVDYMAVSQVDRKLMLATAGGVPPDIAGIWSNQIAVYSENNALTPLDRLAAESGPRREDYIDIFWRACSHRGRLFALPSTPTSTALIWNKKMFRAAGLDPERPPRSLAELEEFNQKLLTRRPDGGLATIGHLPEEPGWWNAMWGEWFGGSLVNDDQELTILSPENLAAYRWVQSYPERFGAREIITFRDGFGNWASPQNAFLSGRVAMVMQGVWIHNYIKNYAPADFEWGVAPFPTENPDQEHPVTVAECDILVIPHGAKHPRESFEFIRYVNSQGPMEKLCMLQRKFSPLSRVSENFYQDHPHPYIREFAEYARSPNAFLVPRVATWTQLSSDLRDAVGRIWLGSATAEQALAEVQVRQQKVMERRRERWNRVKDRMEAQWEREP